MTSGLSSTDAAIVGGVLGPFLLLAVIGAIVVIVIVVMVRPVYIIVSLINLYDILFI